ncbi:MAG: hypothetical protein GY841_15735 [FCB group bacterium]|nr:hypothetical protein [FCB group bacterium]
MVKKSVKDYVEFHEVEVIDVVKNKGIETGIKIKINPNGLIATVPYSAIHKKTKVKKIGDKGEFFVTLEFAEKKGWNKAKS